MNTQKDIWRIDGSKLICYNGKSSKVTIPKSIEEIGPSAFAGNKLISEIVIPDSVHTIGYGAFANCTALRRVSASAIKYIRPYAFCGCTSLGTVELHSSPLKNIGYCVFKMCTALKSFVASHGVKTISEGAFCKCYALKHVSLPEIERIKKYAFSKCVNLETVEIRSTETDIDSTAFHKCNKNLKFVWPTKKCHPEEATNGFDIDENGVLKKFYGCATEIVIPDVTRTIGTYAFEGNTSVKTLQAPTIDKVEPYSFSRSKIESICFEAIEEIGSYAFWACTMLSGVELGERLKRVGADAFGYCCNLKSLEFGGECIEFEGRIVPMAYLLEEIVLPKKQKEIPECAFYFCKALTCIKLPPSLEVIGDLAFWGCERLQYIEIPNNIASLNWDQFKGCSSLREVILLNDGTIMNGRTDEFCTATYRYYNQPRVKTAVIFMGIQGSGKTYYYNWHFAGKYEHVNLDTLHTRNKETQAIQQCIDRGQDFVIDNTNPTIEDRKRYIPMLREAGYRIVGYFFESKIQDCIKRNEQRSGKAKVPNIAIAATSNKLQIPQKCEGFDELYFVERSGGTVMLKRDWRD